jgi:hypothetical protein
MSHVCKRLPDDGAVLATEEELSCFRFGGGGHDGLGLVVIMAEWTWMAPLKGGGGSSGPGLVSGEVELRKKIPAERDLAFFSDK